MNFNEFKEFKDCLLTPRSFIITSIELQVTETKTDGSRLQTHATVFVSALTAAASHFHGSVPLTGRPHCSCSRLCAGVPGHTEQLWTAERARPSSAAEEEEEYDCSAPEGCILTIFTHTQRLFVWEHVVLSTHCRITLFGVVYTGTGPSWKLAGSPRHAACFGAFVCFTLHYFGDDLVWFLKSNRFIGSSPRPAACYEACSDHA